MEIIRNFSVYLLISGADIFCFNHLFWLKPIRVNNIGTIKPYYWLLCFKKFSPFIHHRDMHLISYICIWYRKCMKSAISTFFNEFWSNWCWYCSLYWYAWYPKWFDWGDLVTTKWCHKYDKNDCWIDGDWSKIEVSNLNICIDEAISGGHGAAEGDSKRWGCTVFQLTTPLWFSCLVWSYIQGIVI